MAGPPTTLEWLRDIRALQQLSPLTDGLYLPWSDAAIRPSALALVCNLVITQARTGIVELGSGISTVVLGRLLARRGLRLRTVEHDAAWLDVVTGLVADAGLRDSVDLVHAPLDDVWYDADAVHRALSAVTVDLLLVDGPPAWRPGSNLARLPALDQLGPYLTKDSIIVLDDADRPGERAVAAAWCEAHGLTADHRPEGVAVFTRTDSAFVV